VLKRAGRFNRSHHLFLAPPHEKKSAFKEVTEFAASGGLEDYKLENRNLQRELF